MNKEFIPHEQALALKELGFDERGCFGFWDIKGRRTHVNDGTIGNWNENPYRISAPLYQQTFRWFREQYDVTYSIIWKMPKDGNGYHAEVQYGRKMLNLGLHAKFKDAELHCLKKLIELVQNSQSKTPNNKNMRDRIIKVTNDTNELRNDILQIIGYNSKDDSPIEYNQDDKFFICADELRICADNDDKDWVDNCNYYAYTISSYSAKGTKLFLGTSNELTYVMAYDEDARYSDTTLFIFDNANEIN